MATKTETATLPMATGGNTKPPVDKPAEKKPKKPISQFGVMQRIERLIKQLPAPEAAGVVAWMLKRYETPTTVCNHPGL